MTEHPIVATTAHAATRLEPADPPGIPAWSAALAGTAAAGLALSFAELVAGLLSGAPSLVVAIGATVIDLQPPGAKDFVVALFGVYDKLALTVAVVVVALGLGAGIGILARSRRQLASAGIAGLVLLGLAASLGDPQTSLPLAALSAVASFVVGDRALTWLLDRAPARPTGAADATVATTDPARRRFLVSAGGLGVLAVAGGGVGRALLEGRAQAAQETADLIPPATEIAPPIPAGAELGLAGLTPLVVPNGSFYRIDTALITPSVDVRSWRLRVHGLVDRDTELTFEELVSMPLIERYVTIACVSNEVGGNLVGNAKWTGVRLTDVLDIAGAQASATQIVPRSVDGWTAGFPTSYVTEVERDALIAVKMNDVALPPAHGYPARLIVPGLYGYVSATKWLTELELTTWEGFDAYWVPLGWAKEGPILTQSRIDLPAGGSRLERGVVPVAGVAWAPERGVSAVQVSVDDGPWADARLAPAISTRTWVQWRFDWDATGVDAGRHVLRVRAADGTGTFQDERPSPPAPDGARGHHRVTVTVS